MQWTEQQVVTNNTTKTKTKKKKQKNKRENERTVEYVDNEITKQRQKGVGKMKSGSKWRKIRGLRLWVLLANLCKVFVVGSKWKAHVMGRQVAESSWTEYKLRALTLITF